MFKHRNLINSVERVNNSVDIANTVRNVRPIFDINPLLREDSLYQTIGTDRKYLPKTSSRFENILTGNRIRPDMKKMTEFATLN
jgi:hypothetical protein